MVGNQETIGLFFGALENYLFTFELQKEPVCHKFYVLLHLLAVHPYEVTWQGFSQEFLFYCHSITDDLVYPVLRGTVHEVIEHQTGKVAMQSLENT
jgi:hypothetical protein